MDSPAQPVVEHDLHPRRSAAADQIVEHPVDGVLLVMDAAIDPFNQINVTILGNLEARKLPVLIVANKVDLKDSSPATIKNAFPQHPVVPISAQNGHNVDNLYKKMIKHFR